ncbi:MAG: zinc ribbon domain-containing protein [Gemmatimonadales bacterium]|nr:MAG: zinc ribbon domain-containing protein [Gemmatimonadales bacterium]
MPIYEYDCPACGELFDLLVRSDTAVACPRCVSSRVQRRLSVPAALAKSGLAAPSCEMPDSPAGGCCGGGCGLN